MDKNQLLVLALTNVPAFIIVIIGILINNAPHHDLNERFSTPEMCFAGLEHNLDGWFTRIEAKIY